VYDDSSLRMLVMSLTHACSKVSKKERAIG